LKFKNAEQDDLWDHLYATQAKNKEKINVKKVMDSWTLQSGYPVVTFSRDYNMNSVNVTQKRFLLVKKHNLTKETNYKWEIPVTYTMESNSYWSTETRFWLKQDEGNFPKIIQLNGSVINNNNNWLIANVEQVGFFRVNYDKKNWRLIINQLQNNHTKIGTINRAQILDDLLDLARGGLIDYTLALNATRYLKLEEELIPWQADLKAFSFLDRMLKRTAIYDEWKVIEMKLNILFKYFF